MDSEGASFPPPPPPPPPGSMGAIHIPTYKEQQQVKQPPICNNEDQYLNLPPQLMSTMNKDKKPFTYTPNSLIGEKGLLDLSQIKSPKMKKRLLKNQKDEDEQEQQLQSPPVPSPPQEHEQYFPVSPPRKLNILQELKEQQQYQQSEQKQYSPTTSPLLQQHSLYSQPMQQKQEQPYFEQQQTFAPVPPIRTHEPQSIVSPPICSTNVFPNFNKPAKPFRRYEAQNENNFPHYSPQQQYFNMTPPKKIDIYKETHEQPELPKSPIYVPTLQDQWQQRKQHKESMASKALPPQRQQQLFDYGEEQKPIQSKSFKVLQQMVKEDDEQRIWQPQQWRSQYEEQPNQTNAFRFMHSARDQREEQSEQHRERIIPIQVERQQSQQKQFYSKAVSQPESMKTTCSGASIPSRSFRLLQIMTDDDQQQQQQQQQRYMQHRITTSGFEGADF